MMSDVTNVRSDRFLSVRRLFFDRIDESNRMLFLFDCEQRDNLDK